MNQTEQMREVFISAYNAMNDLLYWDRRQNFIVPCKVRDAIYDAMSKAQQVLADVNETPKNEHDGGDVLNKSGNVDVVREALRQNVRAFRRIKTGAIQYTLGNKLESEWEEVMIIPNMPNHLLDQVLTAEPAPLVRLTDEEQTKIVRLFVDCGLGDWQKLWQCSNAIMDAFLQKNRDNK